jgi:hypothetical protein
MISSYSSPFPSPELSKIRPGGVILDVPLLDGIIQIEAVGETETAQLLVYKEALGNIIVKLTDHKPFQAELVIPEWADGGLTNERLQVFEKPIEALKLHPIKMPQDKEYWVASGFDLSVIDMPRMVKLAWTIGTYTKHKQTANELRKRQGLN